MRRGIMTMSTSTDRFRALSMLLVALAAILVAVLLLPTLALAQSTGANFTVNSTNDRVDQSPGDGKCDTGFDVSFFIDECTLRAAVQEANFSASGETISVPVGIFKLSITGTGEDDAATGDLDILASGGGLAISGVGARSTVIDAAGLDRVFDVLDGAPADFSKLAITGGDLAGNSGGGIQNMGATSLTEAAVQGNGPSFDGGGIYVASPPSGGTATLVVTRSTISGNEANRDGGGIRALSGSITIDNSTISGNRTADDGGGVQLEISASLTMRLSTVAFNTAGLTGGGINRNGSTANKLIENTIVSNNTAPSGKNCSGSGTTTGSHNLENDTTCGFNQPTDINANPELGSLLNNGGPTDTHALLKGSPAIDAADPATCTSTDQRGITRPQDGDKNGTVICDIGAFERDATPPTVTSVTPVENAAGVARNTDVTAKFSEAMNPNTVTASTFKLVDTKTGKQVDASVVLSTDGKTATLDPFPDDPAKRLEANRKYKAKVTTTAKDLAGNALDQNQTRKRKQAKSWTFTTGSN